MLPANGAGVTHRVSGADARRNDQLGGKVGLLATAKTKPPQVIRTELIGSDTCAALGITSRSSIRAVRAEPSVRKTERAGP
jgi:hypothetical protein